MGRNSKTIVGIDIGTSKVSAVVGEIDSDGLSVIGVSSQPSYGVKKGIIINMDSTVDSIKNAVEEVETMAGIDIHSTVVGISGSHITGFNSNGVIPLSNKEVRKNDIAAAMEAAKALVIPMDREVIHILPQEFIVDDQDGIKDPLGMSGVRLESRVYIITSAVASAQNIIRCINRSGLKVQDLILSQLASSESVLTEDEKELGCALIDIGGGTTDISIFNKGSIRHCAVLPIGGGHITSDIAIGIRTPISEAEEIKKDFGQAFRSAENPAETLDFVNIGERETRKISKNTIAQIVKARVEETFSLIHKELLSAGLMEFLPAGVVLTGGTALLNGISEVAKKKLGLPVRIGSPQEINGINDVRNPEYATGAGLILFAARGYMNDFYTNSMRNNIWKVGGKMKQWFAEAF
jgi:cell division protein FtsA